MIRGDAATALRFGLEYAEWLQAEAKARGKDLTYEAAVIAGTSMAAAFSVGLDLDRLKSAIEAQS